MKKNILFITFLLGCVLTMAAQEQLPKKVAVGKPEILKPKSGGTYKKTDLDNEFKPGSKWGTKKTVNEFWQVRSDRDRNPVYADATRSRKLNRTLAFGDQVVIAEVKGDMALVYEDRKIEHYPDIPSYAKYIGWVPMDNLLLWDACPTDQRGVQYKALIAINVIKLHSNNGLKGNLYRSPEDNVDPQDLAMDMEFYFIMKESRNGKRVLLCRNPTVYGNNLYGWIDEQFFSRWNQRACLEPNWDAQYVENHKGQEVGVFADPNFTSGNKVTRWEFGTSNNDKNAWYKYRMNPQQLRFPIIERVEEQANRIHCTSFAKNNGEANYTSDMDKANKEVNNTRKMRGQMNIIFLVEATTEMREIFPAIKASLVKCGSFKENGPQVKVGAVLYRIASQGTSGLEVVPLTNFDDPLLVSKFDATKANGRLSANDRDVALSLAIERAADASIMGFNKAQNNLLLVVGNRGAPESDETLKDSKLLKRMVDNNIQVMSIQIMRNQDGSWANYNEQMRDLIKENVARQYARLNDTEVFSGRNNNDGYNFYSKNNKKDGSVLFAEIRYSKELGKALSATEVTKYVDNGINNFSKIVGTWKKHYEESLGNIKFDPIFLETYLGKTVFEKWKEIKALSAFDGYTRQRDLNGNDYWHYILYLSGDELQQLLADLKTAYTTAKNGSDDRKPYLDAMRSLVKAHLGQTNDKGIDNMDVDELQELIYGLDVHTEMTNRRKLKDIADPRMVTSIEFRKICSNFVKNYEKLLSLFNDGYTYRTKLGKDWYYWIPIEDLP